MRPANHLSDEKPPQARCWRCDHVVDPRDHYCRSCGQGQGAFLEWYYRPLWIGVLALTVLGPFALLLVWRTPRLNYTGRWIISLAIAALSGYVAWELVVEVREVQRLLGVA